MKKKLRDFSQTERDEMIKVMEAMMESFDKTVDKILSNEKISNDTKVIVRASLPFIKNLFAVGTAVRIVEEYDKRR